MLQAKLLRLLQQREYTPVGDNRTLRCDVRIVAATNRDLREEVAAGRFREDLYYRLNVIHLHLPPLRERLDDVEVLTRHFFRMAIEMSGRHDMQSISDEAMEALLAYDWPGNVRELENLVQRAVLLSPGNIVERSDLPASLGDDRLPAAMVQKLPDDGIDLRAAIDEYESNLIRQALERTAWNKNRAAQLLGLNRTTLVEMVKRKGIERGGLDRNCA
jgi:DNA-binding NtrC family response regulator